MRARKVDNNKVNTTVGPPLLTNQTSSQDPTFDKSQGGGGVRNSGPPSGSALVSHGM